MMSSPRAALGLLCALLTSGCAVLRPPPPAPPAGHLTATTPPPAAPVPPIPDLVRPLPEVPPPSAVPAGARYSVEVNEVPVRELLSALAKEARVNMDIHGDLTGKVTLNAIEQTLPQILERVSRQVDLRYQLDGGTVTVMPDAPYFQTYEVGYVNLTRDTEAAVNIATQVATTGEGGADKARGAARGGESQGANASGTRVSSRARNRFWDTLSANVLAMLGKPAPASGQAASDALVVNPEAGLLSVKATSRQHRVLKDYLERVLTNARREVLIEATVVEVTLKDQYQAGVDWRMVLNEARAGFGLEQSLLGAATGVLEGTTPTLTFGFRDPAANGRLIESTLRLLHEFGDTRVLSSPRLMVINNQTALLKVVEELVYFTVEVTNTDTSLASQGRTFVQSEVHSVPVGLVMAVTPHISPEREVTLSVRPTLSQKVGEALDPGPQLASRLNGGDETGIRNLVPVIRTREMESVLKLVNGQVGVLGGLMQDERRNGSRDIPGLSRLPALGNVFRSEETQSRKTELVIFLRPVVINEPGLERDLKAYRPYLAGPAGD